MKSFKIILLCTFFFLSSSALAEESDNVKLIRENTKKALINAEKQVFVQKIKETTTNTVKDRCGGKGYIIQVDGNKVVCPDCGGKTTKGSKLEENTVDKPKDNAIIKFYTINGCSSCNLWKRSGMEEALKKAGWDVETVNETYKKRHEAKYTSYPNFEIYIKGNVYKVEGRGLTYDDVNEAKKKYDK